MNNFNLDDTIVAISTPVGESGIGIIRLSGKNALRAADRIFIPKNGPKPSKCASFSVHYGHIFESKKLKVKSLKLRKAKPKGRESGIIDEVLLTVMRAPRTYTRQDVIEINCHGGIVPLKKILDLVIKEGVRLARPGEFTLRAFLNGRIDLTQAEAVLDIISSKTEKSLELAYSQLEGKFSSLIKDLNKRLLDVYVQIEARIDFPEEGLEFKFRKELIKELDILIRDIRNLLETSKRGIILREGFSVVICGRPNTGKSSLMNVLLNKSRCLVSPIAGTTRDTIEEIANIGGIPVRLTDTAGIKLSRNSVEKEAVSRSHESLKSADLVLLMLDANRKYSREDKELIDLIEGKTKLVLLNKVDLPRKIEVSRLRKRLGRDKILAISCFTQKGIDKVVKEIKDLIFRGRLASSDGHLVTNLRHKEALEKTAVFLESAGAGLKGEVSPEFIAIDIKEGLRYLEEILGNDVSLDVLDSIFSRFCVGK